LDNEIAQAIHSECHPEIVEHTDLPFSGRAGFPFPIGPLGTNFALDLILTELL
jgi:hypothetical protein